MFMFYLILQTSDIFAYINSNAKNIQKNLNNYILKQKKSQILKN